MPKTPDPKPVPTSKVDVSVHDMPEALALLRLEMAKLLRTEAKRQENNVVGWAVTRSLNAVADAFVVGLSGQDFAERRAAEEGR